jgi:CHASE3 domain sensor protein
LTVDNLPANEGLAAQRIQFAEMITGLRRAKSFEAAADAARRGQGERSMNEFQAVVRHLRDEEAAMVGATQCGREAALRGQTKTVDCPLN